MNITLYTDIGSAVLVNGKYILLSLLWLGIYSLFLKTINNKIRKNIGFSLKFDKEDLLLPMVFTGTSIFVTLMVILSVRKINAAFVVLNTSNFYVVLAIIGIIFLSWSIFMLFEKYYKKQKVSGKQMEVLVFLFGLLMVGLISNDLWQYKEPEIEVKQFKIVYIEDPGIRAKSMFYDGNKESVILLNDKSYKLASVIELKPGDTIKMGEYKNKNYICKGKSFTTCYEAKESEKIKPLKKVSITVDPE